MLENVDDGVKIMDTDDILSIKELPCSITIVGGVIGVEVTILELMPTILPMVDPDAAALLKVALEQKEVRVKTEVTVNNAKNSSSGVRLELNNESAIECEAVLEVVGRRADLSGFEVLQLNTMDRGFVCVDAFMQTNMDNVFAVGDVNGGYMLAHKASKEGETAVEAIFGELSEQPMIILFCIFTGRRYPLLGLRSRRQGSRVTRLNRTNFSLRQTVRCLPWANTKDL